MYKELRKKAEKKVQAKMAFYICAVVFGFVSIVLMMLSYYMPSISFWLKLPLPIFVMVLVIIYLSAWGMPFSGALSDDWQEEEVEREMMRLYRRKRAQLPPAEELDESEVLELKELERLKRKWSWDDDYV